MLQHFGNPSLTGSQGSCWKHTCMADPWAHIGCKPGLADLRLSFEPGGPFGSGCLRSDVASASSQASPAHYASWGPLLPSWSDDVTAGLQAPDKRCRTLPTACRIVVVQVVHAAWNPGLGGSIRAKVRNLCLEPPRLHVSCFCAVQSPIVRWPGQGPRWLWPINLAMYEIIKHI